MYKTFDRCYYLNKDKIKAAAINGVKPSLEGFKILISKTIILLYGVVPGLKEFLDDQKNSRGYLTDIGLVPLASDKIKTRTAAKDSYNPRNSC